MIYRAYHSADRTGGRLSPLEDDFMASNKEEEFFSSPPEKEWLPVNRPSGSRPWWLSSNILKFVQLYERSANSFFIYISIYKTYDTYCDVQELDSSKKQKVCI